MFCKKLNWTALSSVLETFSSRLSFGVTEELIPLVRLGVQIMPPFRARVFVKNGIRSPADILSADKNLIVQILVFILIILKCRLSVCTGRFFTF